MKIKRKSGDNNMYHKGGYNGFVFIRIDIGRFSEAAG